MKTWTDVNGQEERKTLTFKHILQEVHQEAT